jgi:hypothetical protein
MTSVELAAVRSLGELRAIVGKRFAEIGVLSCYVAAFEDGGSSAQMRVLVAYNSEASHPESVGGTLPSAALAPDSWLAGERSRAYVVTSVHFDGQELGLMAVSLEAPTYVYDTLGDMMGMALDRIQRLSSPAIESAPAVAMR